MTKPNPSSYAIIGAGPTGLAAARALQRYGIEWHGYELASDVGGLWNIEGPRSTMYESAHLISSKTTTQFDEFPMRDEVADYPSHGDLREYFTDFANHFGLIDGFSFDTEVIDTEVINDEQSSGGWLVTTRDADGNESTHQHAGVIAANGTLSEPTIPTFAGEFGGEIMHTSAYKSPRIFTDKRVLIIGAGNSGCDIAVDAVHHAKSIDMSVRRGYYFVPKYLFGKPADTLNQGKPLPPKIKQAVDTRILRQFTGDPSRFGFPKPDYKIYESHPIVNTLVLHHAGHGDLQVRPDVDRFEETGVRFKDGSFTEYDLIVLATGYRLHYPFLDRAHLNWGGQSPDLYLNIFPPNSPNLFILGMLESSGIGWQGRYAQAELLASYLKARTANPEAAAAFEAKFAGPRPDVTGGYNYLALERMSYYVNKHAYVSVLAEELQALNVAPKVPIGAQA